MPRCCCVLNPHDISKTLFGVPHDEERKKLWEEDLGVKLKKNNHVCATHFNSCDIKSSWESGQYPNKYSVCLKRLHLKKEAIPLFVNINESDQSKNEETVLSHETSSSSTTNKSSYSNSFSLNETLNLSKSEIEKDLNIISIPDYFSTPKKRKIDSINEHSTLYQLVLQNIKTIVVPNNWFANVENDKDNNFIITFHKLGPFKVNSMRYVEKQIIITKGLHEY